MRETFPFIVAYIITWFLGYAARYWQTIHKKADEADLRQYYENGFVDGYEAAKSDWHDRNKVIHNAEHTN